MVNKSIKTIILFFIIFALGVGIGAKFLQKNAPLTPALNRETLFVSEVYDKIKENYWDNISDAQLLVLFQTALGQKFDNKDALLKFIDKTKPDSPKIVQSVLASLNPQGRSGLYTQKQEEQLKNTVSNINPEKDLYKDLGLQKGASEAAVEQAYKQKEATATAEELKKLTYAKETLTQKDQKANYDKAGIEPAVFGKILPNNILLVTFKKFSPTSLDEFQKTFESYKDNSNLNSLILDLRGNVGGAIDATAYFLGFFLGKGQYAFDFYHKGEYLPFKTQTDKLASLTGFKQVIVLIDSNTQSSAEMMAAALKKYHVGVVAGTTSRGWGTVEKVFPLETRILQTEKYSLFLVHSITLRDDNLPIEGRGIEPDIDIRNPDWPQKIMQYFNNAALVEAVKTYINEKN